MEYPTDFIAFYEELGLRPGCTLDELKAAYRRRLSALHPDRPGNPVTANADAAQLQELTTAYTAVTRFQRRHGRMPGTVATTVHGPIPQHARNPTPVPPVKRARRWPWLALAACVAIATMLATQDDAVDPQAEQSAHSAPDIIVFGMEDAAPPPGAAPERIHIGTNADEVRAIEGRPVMATSERWDYGPSWITFSNGQVSDWHSSRLRPLKVATMRPLPAPERRP